MQAAPIITAESLSERKLFVAGEHGRDHQGHAAPQRAIRDHEEDSEEDEFLSGPAPGEHFAGRGGVTGLGRRPPEGGENQA
jgi:hypothetical protein